MFVSWIAVFYNANQPSLNFAISDNYSLTYGAIVRDFAVQIFGRFSLMFYVSLVLLLKFARSLRLLSCRLYDRTDHSVKIKSKANGKGHVDIYSSLQKGKALLRRLRWWWFPLNILSIVAISISFGAFGANSVFGSITARYLPYWLCFVFIVPSFIFLTGANYMRFGFMQTGIVARMISIPLLFSLSKLRDFLRFLKSGISFKWKVPLKKQSTPSITSKTPDNTPEEESRSYQFPTTSLLYTPKAGSRPKPDAFSESAEHLLAVLKEFGVHGEIRGVQTGPIVVRYDFEPAAGIKSSRVINLAEDISRSMKAESVRIAVISGQNAIGIEIPHSKPLTVHLGALLSSPKIYDYMLPIVLGEDIAGEPVMADLASMPHLLIAGTTGSGKSVGLNTMILSLLFRHSPEDCKFIMIDPKMLELSVYNDIPHLLTPVVTDPKRAVITLRWVVQEMERRYRMMSQLSTRNISGYNEKISQDPNFSQTIHSGFDDMGKPIFEKHNATLTKLPWIVVVVDEMADLMLIAGKDIESSVQRLAQMARAAGIHLIMATQRPSVDVITGTIKANFPARISFRVSSKIDSRTILGEGGAEQLLGNGDMLYNSAGGSLRRVHGAFVRDIDVETVATFLRKQGEPKYIQTVPDDAEEMESTHDFSGDDMYSKAVTIVLQDKKTSISYLQRKLEIGYNKSAKLIEQMEENGILSPPNRRGVREILIPDISSS